MCVRGAVQDWPKAFCIQVSVLLVPGAGLWREGCPPGERAALCPGEGPFLQQARDGQEPGGALSVLYPCASRALTPSRRHGASVPGWTGLPTMT